MLKIQTKMNKRARTNKNKNKNKYIWQKIIFNSFEGYKQVLKNE